MQMNAGSFGRNPRRSFRGNTLVLVTIFVTALFGFAALSIDVSHVFQQQRRAQISTDAAALAGVAMLTNSGAASVDAIAQAQLIANANGVSDQEIAASSIGAIQVGQWDTNSLSFSAGTTPYNAVPVPARRTVPMYFAPVVGMRQMTPQVRSVAMLAPAGSVEGARPFGVTSNVIGSACIGCTITVGEKQGNTGQWGQLNFSGSFTNTGDWVDAMLSGYGGTVSVGENIGTTDPGSDWVAKTLNDLQQTGETLIIPVVDTLDFTGKQSVDILGFIGVQVVNVTGGGNAMTIELKIVSAITTGSAGGGGIGGPPWVSVRVLVQ